MQTRLTILLFFCLLIQGLHAQEKPVTEDSASVVPDSLIYWKDGATLNVNLQQVGLTNWAAGGESSVAIGGILEGFLNYEKDDVVWENRARIGYGIIRNGDASNRFEKTDDQVILRSKYSQKFSEELLLTGAVNFQTQMDRGVRIEDVPDSDEQIRRLISNFMSPGYLQTSLGLTYRNKDGFFSTLSPFTGRFTFVLNDSLSNAGAFGVEPGQTIRSEAGVSLTGGYKKDLMENVKLNAIFNLFSNYEKFPNTVVNMEATLNLKVNEFITSNIGSQLIYDDDVIVTRSDGSQGRDIQLKNVINVGFTLGF